MDYYNRLKQILKEAWCYQTCNPRLQLYWGEDQPSYGQAEVTALVVNDFFGGRIMRSFGESGFHHYNEIDGELVDLTSDQFGRFIYRIPNYATGEEITREYLLSNEDIKRRYQLLSSRVDQILKEEESLRQRRFETIKKQREKEEDQIIPEEEAEAKAGNAMRFYLLATKLKNKIRSGWDEKHWNVKSERIESIAEHVYGTCILAISLDSEFKVDIDLEKVLKMLIIHEIGEVLIGDITPFDHITPDEKEAAEHKAMQDVLSSLFKKDELYSLLLEFDAHETNESRFAYMCDKLEADIQAKVYQDAGCQRSLDDQESNTVFSTPRIKKMIEEGAQTAFDIWYEWDKAKFEGAPVFSQTLQYVKRNNTKI